MTILLRRCKRILKAVWQETQIAGHICLAMYSTMFVDCDSAWYLVIWCQTALFEREPLSVSFSLAFLTVQLSVNGCLCVTVTVYQTIQTGPFYGSLLICSCCRSVSNNIKVYRHKQGVECLCYVTFHVGKLHDKVVRN